MSSLFHHVSRISHGLTPVNINREMSSVTPVRSRCHQQGDFMWLNVVLNQEYLKTSNSQKQGGKNKEQLTIYLPCFPCCFQTVFYCSPLGTESQPTWLIGLSMEVLTSLCHGLNLEVCSDWVATTSFLIPSILGPIHQGIVSRRVQPSAWTTLLVWKGSGQEANTGEVSLIEARSLILWCLVMC